MMNWLWWWNEEWRWLKVVRVVMEFVRVVEGGRKKVVRGCCGGGN
jgi:hypothetical protein